MFTFLIAFSILFCYPIVESVADNDTFYYFAYGSNLLAKRIHIQNPSAKFFSPAKLEHHRLDFNINSDTWHGAAATIVEDEDQYVWGALWTMDVNEITSLDDQEGVHVDWYFAKNVTVTTENGTEVMARTYQEIVNPNKAVGDLPQERRPSNTYLQVIALGAIESHLPAEYVGFIFSFPTNGRLAADEMRQQLGYPF